MDLALHALLDLAYFMAFGSTAVLIFAGLSWCSSLRNDRRYDAGEAERRRRRDLDAAWRKLLK